MNALQQIFYLIYTTAYDLFPVNINIVANYTFNGFLFLVWSALIIGLFVIPVFVIPYQLVRIMFDLANQISKGGGV